MPLDPTSREPLYVQLARLLRDQIISGALPLGSAMPGEHRLKALYGVNRWVSKQAYDLLEAEGLCVNRPGLGRYVAAVPPVAVITLQPGDRVRARMPAEAERAELGLAHGTPVLEITRAGGRTEVFSGATAVAETGLLCPL